jgi:hypothetical protein
VWAYPYAFDTLPEAEAKLIEFLATAASSPAPAARAV